MRLMMIELVAATERAVFHRDYIYKIAQVEWFGQEMFRAGREVIIWGDRAPVRGKNMY